MVAVEEQQGETKTRAVVARPPHRPGATVTADAHMAPSQSIGVDVPPPRHVVFSHYHDFYEVAFVTGGNGVHTTDAGEYEVGRGDVIVVSPGVSHGYRRSGDLDVLNLFLRSDLFAHEAPWVTQDPALHKMFSVHGRDPHVPVHFWLADRPFQECVGHLRAIRDAGNRATMHGHLALIIGIMESETISEASPVPVPSMAPDLVHDAVDALERELEAAWTLQDLSNRLFVNQAYLVRAFKRWLGVPPMRYLMQRRVERAGILLATTDLPIAEVGRRVGWSDPAYFSRRFRLEEGESPRGYRAAHRRQAVRTAWPPAS